MWRVFVVIEREVWVGFFVVAVLHRKAPILGWSKLDHKPLWRPFFIFEKVAEE